MIVLLVGMPGSGKEEFKKVAMELGWEVVSMGDVVRNYTTSLGLELNEKNVGSVASSERETKGMDIWARRTLEKIKNKKTVVDGIRNREEVEFFKKNLGEKLVLVAILSSEKTRFQRIINRGRLDDVKNIEEFEERDRRELSWGLGNVISKSDYFIVNEGTLEEFKEKVRSFLNSLKDC
ncbi:MAG: AAA family ATPase [Thermoplasmata archaeon]|jgi:dephospho-CoA kinase|nr:flagellar hook-basal body complex protein FliE [Euryarchaeota archaeon]MVT14139.1 flagellar hook-basal body complex protein FliE [Euryarchaeota archaeon]MVT36035.1 flagellar hook-basal body complex protein FliE [Euryarchaeota archaeon]